MAAFEKVTEMSYGKMCHKQFTIKRRVFGLSWGLQFPAEKPRGRQTPMVLCSSTPPITTMEALTASEVGASSTGWIRSVASARAFLEAVNAFSISGVHTRDARRLRPARATCIRTSISATCGTKR